MNEYGQNESFEREIPPHKARILVVVGAVILVHAALLLIFWPHRWPSSYKWLLLPDGIGAYCILALGISHWKAKAISNRQ